MMHHVQWRLHHELLVTTRAWFSAIFPIVIGYVPGVTLVLQYRVAVHGEVSLI